MFTFKDKTSESMGLKISNNISYLSPHRDVEFVEIAGRNGSLTMDNGRYSDVDFPVPVILKTNDDIEQQITEICVSYKANNIFKHPAWSNDH